MIKAHRLVFELENGGACPPVVDHRCHDPEECGESERCPHRRCCNPRHLVASTSGQNSARGRVGRHQDACRAGHKMTPDNTYESPNGAIRCRRCKNEWQREAASIQRVAIGQRAQRRKYRPRGLSLRALADWALAGQDQGFCCYWPDSRPNAIGCEQISYAGRTVGAHQLIYQAYYGATPADAVIDHICHDPKECPGGSDCPHRACINPRHFKATTSADNTSAERSSRRRPKACKYGHEFTPENTYVDKTGARHCRTCGAARLRAARKTTDRVDQRYRIEGKCRNGHDVAAVGLTKTGRCRECKRARGREYMRRKYRETKEIAAGA